MNKDVITGFIVAFLSTSFMYITSEKVQDEIYEEEVKTEIAYEKIYVQGEEDCLRSSSNWRHYRKECFTAFNFLSDENYTGDDKEARFITVAKKSCEMVDVSKIERRLRYCLPLLKLDYIKSPKTQAHKSEAQGIYRRLCASTKEAKYCNKFYALGGRKIDISRRKGF